MSRSRKKVNISGMCGNSEKWDKKNWHKRFRRKNTIALRNALSKYDIDIVFPVVREVSDVWRMNKDGKFPGATLHSMRLWYRPLIYFPIIYNFSPSS